MNLKRLRINWEVKLAKVRRLKVPCGVCHENDAHSDVKTARRDVSCVGSCHRKFHLECLHMSQFPDSEWKCADCAPAASSTAKSPRGYKCQTPVRRSYQTRATLRTPRGAKGSVPSQTKPSIRDPREILWVQSLLVRSAYRSATVGV